jgi:hypothetical protein
MKLKRFDLKLPKLTTKTVWLSAYGGHYDVIVIALEDPGDKKCETWGDDDNNYLQIPDGSLTTDPGAWEVWFGPIEELVELGIYMRLESGVLTPLDTHVIKWVKAEISLPIIQEEATVYGSHSTWEQIVGLELDQEGYNGSLTIAGTTKYIGEKKSEG